MINARMALLRIRAHSSGLQKRKKGQKPSLAKAATNSDVNLAGQDPAGLKDDKKVPVVPSMLPETRVLSPEELQEGVHKIRDVFPDIHQTVAELTLQVRISFLGL